MCDLAAKNERRCRALYDLIEPYDAFVGRFINRPHGLSTSRPEDYLACVLLVRSLRLLIGGLWLAASGYPDLSPNLGRTIWEIAIRLLYSQKDPKAAAFGFFMYADSREIETMEAELAHRQLKSLPVGHLRKNCQTLRDHRDYLVGLAQSRSVDVVAAVKAFGKLNIRRACQEIGVEKAYLVDYSFESGHVHERNLTTDSFMSTIGQSAQYEAGPTEQPYVCDSTFDVLRNFSLVAAAYRHWIASAGRLEPSTKKTCSPMRVAFDERLADQPASMQCSMDST